MKANIPDMSDNLYADLARNEFWEKRNMELYMEAIGQCAEIYSTKNIIIRPHPAEDREIWTDFVKGLNLQNVSLVSSQDSILPWLMAAHKTITHNCTTSLESALLGKISINYTPIKDNDWEYELPLLVSSTARDFETLIKLINKPTSKIYADDEIVTTFKLKDGTFAITH